jgi:hypothetical protein
MGDKRWTLVRHNSNGTMVFECLPCKEAGLWSMVAVASRESAVCERCDVEPACTCEPTDEYACDACIGEVA